MSDRAEAAAMDSCQIVERFVNWLYDESPVWPDEVPRERLLALWVARHDPPGPTGNTRRAATTPNGATCQQPLHPRRGRASLGPQRCTGH